MNTPPTSTRKFAPHGPLAIAPTAFGEMFAAPTMNRGVRAEGDVALVDIRGPLVQFDGEGWFDSYESIRARVATAFASSPRAVVLRIASPGGVVSGCFATVRALRALAGSSSVPLVAYVDGGALSGGYALACAASKIYAPREGSAGSIGVIAEVVDATAAAAMQGLRVSLIASGERKADGSPNAVTSTAARAAIQQNIDAMAGEFFALVGEARGLPVKSVKALEGRTLVGAEAKAAGLVDVIVDGFHDVIAELRGRPAVATSTKAPAPAAAAPAARARAAAPRVALAAASRVAGASPQLPRARHVATRLPQRNEAMTIGQVDDELKRLGAKMDALEAFNRVVSQLRKIVGSADEKEASRARRMLAVLDERDTEEGDDELDGAKSAKGASKPPFADPDKAATAAMDRVMGFARREPVRVEGGTVHFGAMMPDEAARFLARRAAPANAPAPAVTTSPARPASPREIDRITSGMDRAMGLSREPKIRATEHAVFFGAMTPDEASRFLANR